MWVCVCVYTHRHVQEHVETERRIVLLKQNEAGDDCYLVIVAKMLVV